MTNNLNLGKPGLAGIAALFIAVLLAACGGSGGSSPAGGGSTAATTLQSISITPSNSSLGIGGSQTFVATGSYADGSSQNISSSVTWASSAQLIADISASGVSSALSLGSTNISAAASGVTGTTPLTVTSKTLQSISIAPANSSLGIGGSQTFVATGAYSDGSSQNISSSVTWASSTPSVASINTSGISSALATGSTNITAAVNGVTGTTPLNVTNKTLQSIAVTPAFVSINTAATQQLTATGTYSDGTTQNLTSSVTWTTADAAIATVSTGGLVTGVAAQNGNAITATSGLAKGISRVSVTSPADALTGLVLAPSSMFVSPKFQIFPYPDATWNNGTGSTNYTYVSWTSSNPAVAIVDSSQGIKAIAAGTTTLTASTGSLTASNTLTVSVPTLSSIIVLPIIPTIAAGSVLQMTATGLYSDGNQKDITTLSGLTWSSGNTGAVTIGTTGIASGIASGSATITATASGKTGITTATVPATVTPPTTVTLSPVNDNTIFSSSLNTNSANTVYPVNAWFAAPGIGVGCAWYYSPAIGYAPERIDATCSQALLKFDLTALAGKTIASATLRLQTSAYGVGHVPRQWFIHALAPAASWSGSTVTWNSALSFQYYTYSETIQNPPTYSGQIYELDQTTTVRNWVAGVYTNNGYELGLTSLLYPTLYDISLDAFEFHSIEDSGGRGPKLIVTYQ